MTPPLRVALFSDSHYETNGVARTTLALEAYARRRGMPLLSVHAGSATGLSHEDSITRLELGRWSATSFHLEHDLTFDVAMWRHLGRVAHALKQFRPDVLHFTGPSDIGQLGAFLGLRLGIPIVGSWHTNLHEYAAPRIPLTWLPGRVRCGAHRALAWTTLGVCLLFYRIPHVVLAPNDELLQILERGTGRPTFHMSRGVDVDHFTPAKRSRTDTTTNIGYVGRLSPEKSVRVLVEIDRALSSSGESRNTRFTIVGDGLEQEWLRRHLPCATFTGVLRGEALASAYADMDLFVFPSQTETVGNVVLEAMASGVPVVAMAQGGPRFVAGLGESAVLASDHQAMIEAVQSLVREPARRHAMGSAARAWALGRSWDAIFDGVYRAYETAVGLPGAPASAGHDEALARQSSLSGVDGERRARGEGAPDLSVPRARASVTGC
jgi:glycosyltransferase involved in cell wall biosynthesis